MLNPYHDREKILQILAEKVPALLPERPVMLAYLHGSVVNGTTLPDSDVDIAIVLEPELSLTGYERLKLELAIARDIEDECNLADVDVRSIDNAPLSVQGNVITNGMLLYSKNEEFRVEYQTSVLRRYLDFLPVLTRMRKAFIESIKREGLSGGRPC